ncbi:germin-like protein [Musa troglodytarum]|uniref:Germin-like protein n=1 Tax=Musa troglodytarum TaxID=320322 RepID=A0A9E7G591_9LILI|nr:germin-like protein [Musa troglodytarum]
MAAKTLLLALLAMASSLAMASDPSPLQDFCVADKDSKVLVNGFVCKDPKVVKAEDFFFRGLDKAGDTGKKLGSNVTAVNVNKLAGLNTLGISMVRIDYAPRGLNPPTLTPRHGDPHRQLFVGFVTSNSDNGNRLFTKMLKKGDVFVFPQGLIHFQFNPGYTNTVAIGALSSQNPGTITIADAVFGSKPPISDEVLAKAFQVDKKTIDWLQAQRTFQLSDQMLKNVSTLPLSLSLSLSPSIYIHLLRAFVPQHRLLQRWQPKSSSSLLAMASSLAMASDPSPLQDFCVADKASKVLVNGFVCKDPMQVTAEDFFAMGLDKAGNTENKVGSMVTAVNVNKLAGLNTLGISMVRIDYAPRGLNPPHTHPVPPRSSPTALGRLRHIQHRQRQSSLHQDAEEGRRVCVPEGLIHFQFNPGHTKTVAIGALSSQNPGTITIANAVFGSKPPISDDVLAKAFQAGDTGKKLGSNVTAVNVNKIVGLNTLGISMVRIDYAPKGLNAPHTHPRATEILTVIEGQLFVGFVTSNSDNGNRLFTKMLKKGDVFVFPEGLIHFQFNPGHTNTVAIGALSSQNPGTITIANAVFGSKPPISDEVLAKAFQVDKKTIDWLQAQF